MHSEKKKDAGTNRGVKILREKERARRGRRRTRRKGLAYPFFPPGREEFSFTMEDRFSEKYFHSSAFTSGIPIAPSN